MIEYGPEKVRALALAAGFKVWRDGRITAADGMVSGAASDCVTSLIALVRAEVLKEAEQAVDAPMSVEQAAEHFGWSEAEFRHAQDNEDTEYGNETVIVLANGRAIHCPSFPAPCDYVRVVEGGYELGYWNCDEWEMEPTDVMGAFIGLARKGLRDTLVTQRVPA